MTVGTGIDSCRAALELADRARGGLRRARHRPASGRRRGGEPRRRAARRSPSTIERSQWGDGPRLLPRPRAARPAASPLRGAARAREPSSASPVVIHTRDADADTADVLAASTARSSCTASRRRACSRRSLERGYYVSFAGNVTYPKASDLRAAAAQVPDERILVETDSPYLAPQTRRGRPNEPANVMLTLAALADVRGVDARRPRCADRPANAAAAFSLP